MKTLAELRAWAADAPVGTLVPAAQLAALLEELEETAAPVAMAEAAPETWRERLWTVPAETRIGVAELAEALARPVSYIYARTGPKSEDPIPVRKLDGSLVFVVRELRAWIRQHEDVVHAGPVEARSLRSVG